MSRGVAAGAAVTGDVVTAPEDGSRPVQSLGSHTIGARGSVDDFSEVTVDRED